MNIDSEKLRSFAVGAARVFDDAEGTHLNRFTARQKRAFDDSPGLRFKTEATAGIRLEFTTDADRILMDYLIKPGSSRTFYRFDVFADGIQILHHGRDTFADAPEQTLVLNLDGRAHRIEIWFPCLACAVVRNLELQGASFAEPVERKCRLLAFGDSITQGYDAVFPSLTYLGILARSFDMEVFNKAVGGDIHRPALLDEPEPAVPDRIWVACGTNDWSHLDAVSLEERAEAFYRRLRDLYPDTPVAVLLPLWRADFRKSTRAGSFAGAAQTLRKCASIHPRSFCLDGISMIPHIPQIFSDGYLHPNDTGFQILARNLERSLRLAGWK